MSEIRTQSFTDDGRRAELVVKAVENGCEKQTVTEVYVEPKIEKKLAKVVIEDQKPFVYKRTTEVVDEATGEVVERQVEDLNPGTKLQVVERLVSAAHGQTSAATEDAYVTREELRDDLMSVLSAMNQDKQPESYTNSHNSAVASTPAMRVQSLVASRVDANSGSSLWDWVVKGVIVAQVVFIVYIAVA